MPPLFELLFYILKKKDDKGNIVRNELAEGQFKNLMAALSPSFPEANGAPRKIMEAAEGFEVLGLTSVRKVDKDKNNIKYYTALESVQVM